MSLVSIDPQAKGWQDDGTESGTNRINIAQGNLIPIPFRTNNCNISAAGTASAVINAVNLTNFDNTSTGMFCTIPANAALGGGLRISFWFNGPILSLRYTEVTGFALPKMAVNIDGVSYSVPASQSRDAISNDVFTNAPAELQQSIIAKNLGEGAHFAEILLQQDTTINTRVYLHGFSVAESSGYVRAPSGIKCGAAQIAVTGTYGNILSGNSALASVRKLFFYNTTGSAITVSVRSSSTAANPFYVKSVPANDTIELDFGGLAYDITTIQVVGSTTGVICSLMGAQ